MNNGGFEQLLPGAVAYSFDKAKFWGPIDTNKVSYVICSSSLSIANAPNLSTGFQYPRSGKNFVLTTYFCESPACTPNNNRQYPRNRLKQTLKPNTQYCAKYYVVNTNNSTCGISNFGVYFGSGAIDSIKYCIHPMTYITPQVQNTSGLITDTLNWVPISGTFTAVGNEKYMVLGNFNNNPSTNSIVINPTYLPSIWTDAYIDDVSLIELNLPAFAGRDTFFIPGDSIYLGRPRDVGIDEDCMWYKLPNTTTAIDTVAGLWVKPSTTCTYVVKQDICGVIKWDTVVLYQSAIGINELDFYSQNIKLYPQPAQDAFIIQFNFDSEDEFKHYSIYNNLGQLIREEEIAFKNKTTTLNISGIAEGVYSLQFKSNKNITVSKRFVVAR